MHFKSKQLHSAKSYSTGMSFFNLFLFLCLLSIFALFTYAAKDDNCSVIKNCEECIATEGCAWCSDSKYGDNPNILFTRCGTVEYLAGEQCDMDSILEASSSIRVISDRKLSQFGEDEFGPKTLIKPQAVDVALAAGKPVDIHVSFGMAKDQPVDLYYLMANKTSSNYTSSFQNLGRGLIENLTMTLQDLLFGFGIIDAKREIEHASMIEYIFKNKQGLSYRPEDFIESVESVASFDELPPADGFDALAQAVLCQASINWRRDSLKFLIYASEYNTSFIKDSKATSNPTNTDYCSSPKDYSTIESLLKMFRDENIIPIFVVPSNFVSTYSNLLENVPNLVIKNLNTNPVEVLNSIQDAYNKMESRIVLDLDTPEEIEITHSISTCANYTTEGVLACDRVKLGDVVDFSFQLDLSAPLSEPTTVTVSPNGFQDRLNITVRSKMSGCSCGADATRNCSGHGAFNCGVCLCDAGYTGRDCSCDASRGQTELSYLEECVDPSTDSVCGNRGECYCGACICRSYSTPSTERISGRYCECSDASCVRVRGEICNGHGTCNYGDCECDDLWTGNACECSLDSTPCYNTYQDASNSTKLCSGRGQCECGVCRCESGQYESNGILGTYGARGQFCDHVYSPDCASHRDCVQCLIFGTRHPFNESTPCTDNCKDYTIAHVDKNAGDGFIQNCTFTDSSRNHTFQNVQIELVNGSALLFPSSRKVVPDCDLHEKCVQCLAFKTGVYDTTEKCQDNCKHFKTVQLSNITTMDFEYECRYNYSSIDQMLYLKNCSYNVYLSAMDDEVVVVVEQQKGCEYPSKTTTWSSKVIIGVIVGVVLLFAVVFVVWVVRACRSSRGTENSDQQSRPTISYSSVKKQDCDY